MQRLKNILLVLASEAGSQSALDRAVLLAKKNMAYLTVAKIVPLRPRGADRIAETMSVSDAQEFAVQARRGELEKLIEPVQQCGIRVHAEVLSGTAFLEIIREVLRQKHDLVIITANDDGGLKRHFCCSTALHLMRKCPCPVWVMKPTQGKRFARILAAVDTDPYKSDTEHDAMNTKIMALASSLAEREQGELHIVHAWTMYGESLFRSSAGSHEGRGRGCLCSQRAPAAQTPA